MSFLEEIKRRKVFQVAAVYAVVAWLIVQVVGAINEPLSLPDGLDTVVIVLLAVGFPIAVILAWAFDITPLGVKTTRETGADSAATHSPSSIFLNISLGLIMLAVGFLVVDQYLLGFSGQQSRNAGFEESVDEFARPVARFRVTPPARAPLANTPSFDVAISHDGASMVYHSRDAETGQVALYLREFDSLEARRIPGSEVPAPRGDLNPFFSADDTWIGFHAPDQGVMRIAVDGGSPIKMFDAPSVFIGAAWASDDTLIYSSGDGLFRVSASGGGVPQRLTPETDSGRGLYVAPVLLPGEQAVLYSFIPSGAEERLMVLDLETGEEKRLAGVGDGAQNPFYAPTGQIVYGMGTTLMAVSFDINELEVSGSPVNVLQDVRRSGAFSAIDYGLSEVGTLIYVPDTGTSGSDRELVWVDRSGQATERAVSDPVNSARDPRLSPNGRQLTLTIGQPGSGEIWIYDLTGRPRIPLSIAGDNSAPVWSPDGERIAFFSFRGTRDGVYILPADGSVRELLPLRPVPLNAYPADWSNEGELILRRPGNANPEPFGEDIIALEVESDDDLRNVMITPDNEFDASLSPNGEWLAYVTDRTGLDEVWVMRNPGGVPVPVSEGGGYEPRWSRDGLELYFISRTSMMAVSFDAEGEFPPGRAEELFPTTDFYTETSHRHSYDVASDGRFLMIRRITRPTDEVGLPGIVVVQNWFEELNRLVPTRH